MDEIWRDIKGYEGRYQVSNRGNVKSLPRLSKGKMLKGSIKKLSLLKNGYFQVKLSDENGNGKTFLVHRLIAKAFIPNPDNKLTVNHINTVKTDNNVQNLEWMTIGENLEHAHENNLFPEKKLSDKDIDWIKKHYKKRDKTFGCKALCVKFGVSRATFHLAVSGKKY